MIINSGTQEVAQVIGEVDTSNTMRMNLTAQSYSLILENLYKDPLGAVLRELSTNAVEAHQMAGNTHKKVSIQLPTMLDTDLIIRDFGTGLNSEEIEKYLNCLFSSSKGDDNDSMGGFGLGSKSPLALVDSFNLVSIKNGIQYDYMWIKESGQIPKPIFQGESKTTRENGITITVPLGSSTKVPLQNLQRYVANAANRQLFGFQDQVRIVDNALLEYDKMVDLSSKLFTARKILSLPNIDIYYDESQLGNRGYYRGGYTAKSYIQIGSVVYDYSFADIDFSKLASYFNNLSSFVVNIKVPIGVLELPMSREEVNITDKNKRSVQAAYDNALIDIKNHIATLSFNTDTDAAGYYTQIKSYSVSLDSTSLSYKLYPDIAKLKAKEKETLDLYSKYVQKVLAANPQATRLDEDYASLTSTSNPSYDLLRQFNKLPKEYFKLSVLSSNGIRDSGSIVECSVDKYAYFFTTTRLPGNMRYKDLYSYIKKLHPNATPMLIQTPMNVDPEIVKHFTKHLENLIEFFSATDSVVSPLVADQVLKDYAKSLRTAATGSIMTTKDYCPGIRIIDVGSLKRDFGSFTVSHVNNTTTTVGILSGTNNHRVLKLVDDKGVAIPQGPSYVSDNAIVLLTDNSTVALDISKLPNGLNSATVDFSLQDVYIYKVPTKILDKTKKLLEDDGLVVHMVSTDDTVPTVSHVAKLPEFTDLTDKTSQTYLENAAGILRKVFVPFYEFYGWRLNTIEVMKRIQTVISSLAATYTGEGEDLVKEICSNKAIVAKLTGSVGNYSSHEITLSVDSKIIENLTESVKDLTLKNLKGVNQLDWMDNTSNFIDNKIYTSHTVRLFFSQLGFSL